MPYNFDKVYARQLTDYIRDSRLREHGIREARQFLADSSIDEDAKELLRPVLAEVTSTQEA